MLLFFLLCANKCLGQASLHLALHLQCATSVMTPKPITMYVIKFRHTMTFVSRQTVQTSRKKNLPNFNLKLDQTQAGSRTFCMMSLQDLLESCEESELPKLRAPSIISDFLQRNYSPKVARGFGSSCMNSPGCVPSFSACAITVITRSLRIWWQGTSMGFATHGAHPSYSPSSSSNSPARSG